MKKIILILLILKTTGIFAQVGINTTNPDPSSMLDISSTDKGLLIPRVNLVSTTDIITILNPATGLLVYNTSTVNNVSPGFYYWDTIWKSLGNSNSNLNNNWSLEGNNITSSHFIGTTNFFPIVFKTFSTQIAKFHPNGGITLGIMASSNDNHATAIGNNANASAVNANAIGANATVSGFQSTAIGTNSNASAVNAIALGSNATASGFRSSVIGYNAVGSHNDVIAIGTDVKAFGFRSLVIGNNATGNNNDVIVIGLDANATGYQSTAIGVGTIASGMNSTVIGHNAKTNQSDAIILGNSLNGNNKVGIGTDNPQERLHVVGSIKIADGNEGIDKVLTSDATGKASWKAPSVKSYASIYYNNFSSQSLSSIQNVNFGGSSSSQGVIVDTDGITVLKSGAYRINYALSITKSTNGKSLMGFNLTNNGFNVSGSYTNATLTQDDSLTISNSVIVVLNANDKIAIKNTTSDSNISIISNGASLNLESL